MKNLESRRIYKGLATIDHTQKHNKKRQKLKYWSSAPGMFDVFFQGIFPLLLLSFIRDRNIRKAIPLCLTRNGANYKKIRYSNGQHKLDTTQISTLHHLFMSFYFFLLQVFEGIRSSTSPSKSGLVLKQYFFCV